MERGSDKHAPEIDDQMKRESEGLERGRPQDPRVEEARVTEGPAEDERGGEPVSGRGEGPTRADLARFVQPYVFPADRDELLASAREMQAPPDVVDAYGRLPAGRVFGSVDEVWQALSDER